MRRQHFARATPGSPEIDDNRNIGTAYMPLECGASEFDRLSSEQSLMALATAGLFAETGRGNTVDCAAMRANHVHSFTHVKNPDSANTNVLGPDKSNSHTQARATGAHDEYDINFHQWGLPTVFQAGSGDATGCGEARAPKAQKNVKITSRQGCGCGIVLCGLHIGSGAYAPFARRGFCCLELIASRTSKL
jgi:hypothetical protein